MLALAELRVRRLLFSVQVIIVLQEILSPCVHTEGLGEAPSGCFPGRARPPSRERRAAGFDETFPKRTQPVSWEIGQDPSSHRNGGAAEAASWASAATTTGRGAALEDILSIEYNGMDDESEADMDDQTSLVAGAQQCQHPMRPWAEHQTEDASSAAATNVAPTTAAPLASAKFTRVDWTMLNLPSDATASSITLRSAPVS